MAEAVAEDVIIILPVLLVLAVMAVADKEAMVAVVV
jgi:hypothetical protein